MSRKPHPPRWIVSCVGHPTVSYDEKTETASAASSAYVSVYAGLKETGGIVCVVDCETGREQRFRVTPRRRRS